MHVTLYQVLALLGSGPSEAVEVMRRLEEIVGDGAPTLPSFYRHLRRGIDEGWIEVEASPVQAVGRGRPRQWYRITAAGKRALRDHALELEAFTRLALDGTSGSG